MPDDSSVPQGYHTVTPNLIVYGASDAIEFYTKAFGAREISRLPGGRGELQHAELQIGSSRIWIADEAPLQSKQGPMAGRVSPVLIHLYVADADAVFANAVAAGAKVVMPVEDAFWGDRYGRLEDPFGHQWSIATRKEDLSMSEIISRAPTTEL